MKTVKTLSRHVELITQENLLINKRVRNFEKQYIIEEKLDI